MPYSGVDQAGIHLRFHLDGIKMIVRGSLNQYKPITKRPGGKGLIDRGFQHILKG